MKLSPDGLKLLKHLEGFSGEPYKDSAGKVTIGYGHQITKYDDFDCPLTQEQAEGLLCKDVAHSEEYVTNTVNVPLSPNQFDALVMFTFNVGCAAFAQSNLRIKLNSGDYTCVPKELRKWVNSGGQRVQGLVSRREAEITHWNT